jgi:DNA-binding Lrp family transcriptional regulator
MNIPAQTAIRVHHFLSIGLAAHPEIPFAAATTGPTNLVASAVFRDTRHLYEYLTGELAALPGVSSVQTAPVIATFKRTGSVH